MLLVFDFANDKIANRTHVRTGTTVTWHEMRVGCVDRVVAGDGSDLSVVVAFDHTFEGKEAYDYWLQKAA
jgi:hypothetical protein